MLYYALQIAHSIKDCVVYLFQTIPLVTSSFNTYTNNTLMTSKTKREQSVKTFTEVKPHLEQSFLFDHPDFEFDTRQKKNMELHVRDHRADAKAYIDFFDPDSPAMCGGSWRLHAANAGIPAYGEADDVIRALEHAVLTLGCYERENDEGRQNAKTEDNFDPDYSPAHNGRVQCDVIYRRGFTPRYTKGYDGAVLVGEGIYASEIIYTDEHLDPLAGHADRYIGVEVPDQNNRWRIVYTGGNDTARTSGFDLDRARARPLADAPETARQHGRKIKATQAAEHV